MSDPVESLDSIFSNDDAPAEVIAEEPTAVVVEETAAPVVEEPAKPAEAAKEPAREPVRPEVAAIIDERKKRQQAERELQELRAKQTPQDAFADFWADPAKATEETVRKFVDPIKNENFKLRMELAETRFPDFGDCVKAFVEAAQTDETLAFQVDHSPDPIAFAYREGKRLKELAPYGGDFSKYAEGVTGQLKTEIATRDERIKALEAQLAEAQKSKEQLESIPRSLNKGTEAAPRSNAEADDDDIASIVRFNRNR